MSVETRLSVEYLKKVAATASYRYKVYSVPKRTGGRRRIEHPSRELKLLQSWLADELFSALPVSEAVYSYREGRGIRQHAAAHRLKAYLLRVDIKDFFPSVLRRDI
jgi:hypothetical protein